MAIFFEMAINEYKLMGINHCKTKNRPLFLLIVLNFVEGETNWKLLISLAL